MRHFLILSLAVLMVSCASAPQLSLTAGNTEQTKNLFEVKHSGFDSFYLAESITLNELSIYTLPLDVSGLEIDERRLSISQKPWHPLTEKEQMRLSTRFDEKMAAELSDQERPESEAVADIVAQFKLVKFVPSTSKDSIFKRSIGDEVYTRSVGALTLEVVLTDRKTKKIVGFAQDTVEVGEKVDLEQNSRVNNTRKIYLTFDRWIHRWHKLIAAI